MRDLIRKILKEQSTSKITSVIETESYTNGEVPNVSRQLPNGWRIYAWKDINNINKDTKYNDKLIIDKDGYITTKWINGDSGNEAWDKKLFEEYFWGDNWLTKLLKSWKIVANKKPDELIYYNGEINGMYKNKSIDFNGIAFGMKEVDEKTDKHNKHTKSKNKYPNAFD